MDRSIKLNSIEKLSVARNGSSPGSEEGWRLIEVASNDLDPCYLPAMTPMPGFHTIVILCGIGKQIASFFDTETESCVSRGDRRYT